VCRPSQSVLTTRVVLAVGELPCALPYQGKSWHLPSGCAHDRAPFGGLATVEDLDLLLIENVGNLVCCSYDLGEAANIVVLSVTEGEDKPLKYPSIFFRADLLVLSKIDLLPYVPFGIEEAAENARKVHPGMEIVKLSCLHRSGLHDWMMWLAERRTPRVIVRLAKPRTCRLRQAASPL
jgi:hydrogenase accessory protein HypB